MSQSTLAVLPPLSFPQVVADRAALDAARLELGISDGDRLSTLQVRAYLQRAQQIKLDRQLPNCTHLDQGGYQCGDPAIVQFLPNGDEAYCGKHLREVSRG
jgi:hypothetical protein